MKINEHTALSTSKLLLVPYSEHHVETYHAWMQDAALQLATASEPLTLDEEYEMQRSWRRDSDKLTFIVCLPLDPEDGKQRVDDSPARMVGDVNLFLFPIEDDDHDEDEGREVSSDHYHHHQQQQPSNNGLSKETKSTNRHQLIGELELMIARKDLQGHGYGRASLVTFMHYILTNWARIAEEFASSTLSSSSSANDTRQQRQDFYDLAYLRAKIHAENDRSIALFTSVGFQQVGQPNYFGELELRWHHDLEYVAKMRGYEDSTILDYR